MKITVRDFTKLEKAGRKTKIARNWLLMRQKMHRER